MSDKIASMRVDQEAQEIKCFTKNSRMVTFSYDVLHVIDDLGIEGLPIPKREAKREYLVLDWINVYRGGNHPYDYIEDKDSDFVKRILFYPNLRITGQRASRKDACALSFMTEEQLKSIDYSESYVLLKSREMMKNAGMKGSKNGTQATTGKPAYLSLKIDTILRETYILHKNEYDDTDTIKFINDLDNDDPLRYTKYLEQFLGSPSGRRKVRGSQNPSRQAEV